MNHPVKRLHVVTHRDPAVADDAVVLIAAYADKHGIELVVDPVEVEKHQALSCASLASKTTDLCDAAIVLAGDGTLLRTLAQVGKDTPVLGVNFGMLGFLSGALHTEIEQAMKALTEGSYKVKNLPGLELDLSGRGTTTAVNDVVATGGITGRVNELGWRIISDKGRVVDEMGTVACDGMVLATPAGSTAYNLSNGGPILAWGVKGAVVSFVAPHTLAARPLVVGPDDEVEAQHMGRGAPLKVFADGVQVGHLCQGEKMRVRRCGHRATLAFVDSPSFYARYRDSFAVPMMFQGPRVRKSLKATPESGSDS